MRGNKENSAASSEIPNADGGCFCFCFERELLALGDQLVFRVWSKIKERENVGVSIVNPLSVKIDGIFLGRIVCLVILPFKAG